MKCIIRFAYYKPAVWPDYSGSITEPPTERILNHISSLATVLPLWTHAIVAVQSGLIGPWGEGHASTHFRCSAAEDGKRQIIDALLDAVPGRDVQLRYPNLKQELFYSESPLTVVEDNVVLNAEFEITDSGYLTGAESWSSNKFPWVSGDNPTASDVLLTSTDSISGNSMKVLAGFSAAQVISLTAEQGAEGNIVKLFGNSKLINAPEAIPGETDYSIYADITFTEGDPLYGEVASFCGSGEWEYADKYLKVPSGKTIQSISVHLMYRNAAQGHALFDNVGITIYNPYSLAVSNTNAFDGSDISRTGHHNDCFVASDTDLGTYTNIDDEKTYLESDTKYTSMVSRIFSFSAGNVIIIFTYKLAFVSPLIGWRDLCSQSNAQ